MSRKRALLGVALGALLVVSGSVDALPPFMHAESPLTGQAMAADDAAPARSAEAAAESTLAGRLQGAIAGLLAAAQLTQLGLLEEEADQSPDEVEDGTDRSKRTDGSRRDLKPSDKRKLKLIDTITGGLTPKSIVSAQNGKIFAMNMMYGHSISVFNRRAKRIKVIEDSVNLAKFGYERAGAKVLGAPVEAALHPTEKRLYVSNYSMYGPTFDHPGFDLCTSSDRIDRSFVYEISTETLRKTNVFEVGEVPKYLAVTPDGRYLLVGNWCSWDISVVDLRKGREVRRIDAGVAPRGIAFSPNSRTAYVTLVGEHKILVIDLRLFKVKRVINGLGERPRHLVMSPNGRHLYVTVQGDESKRKVDGRIVTYDTKKRKVVARSRPMTEPRTTVMAPDGRSLYVVDYYPGKLVKLRARDLAVLQEVYLGYHPIGVTYDDASDTIWVAGYGGSVWVLKDR